jgi:hypothetical protein
MTVLEVRGLSFSDRMLPERGYMNGQAKEVDYNRQIQLAKNS